MSSSDLAVRARPAVPWGRLLRNENVFLLVVLVGLIVGFTIATPAGTFLSVLNFKNIALDTAEIFILAAGQTFIIIAAGIDLSIGSLVVFSAVVSAQLMVQLSGTTTQVENAVYPHLASGLTVGVLAGVLAGAGWGFFNGFVTVKFRIPSFITTLGSLGMALGLAQVITGGLNVANVPPQIQDVFGSGSLLGIPWLVVVAAIVLVVMWTLLSQTRFGLRTYAIGSNIDAARRAGINVDWHVIGLFVLMGALCGIVGILDVARFDTASISAHSQDNLAAIAAVVIGGTSLYGGRGGMGGTIIGALIPSILRNGFILVGVQPYWQNVAIGAVLVLAVFIDQRRRRRVDSGIT
jgi:ribose transport system permease protein